MAIVTLTTDFGLADHFTGAMKGVILGIAPRAAIVDITHQVEPYEISQAAFLITQAYTSFPPGTVHVVVVDPGVGTSRRPILVEAARQIFIAPDNGVLSGIYAREKHKVRAVTADRYFRKPVSRTFHGRDIFAPVAAHVAAGVAPSKMGRLVKDYLRREYERPLRTGKRMWSGSVLHIDRFGNVITNFMPSDLPPERPFEIAVGPHRVSRVASNYAESAPGELFLIEGSAGYLEISMNQGPAARTLGCGVGAPVDLTTY